MFFMSIKVILMNEKLYSIILSFYGNYHFKIFIDLDNFFLCSFKADST